MQQNYVHCSQYNSHMENENRFHLVSPSVSFFRITPSCSTYTNYIKVLNNNSAYEPTGMLRRGLSAYDRHIFIEFND